MALLGTAVEGNFFTFGVGDELGLIETGLVVGTGVLTDFTTLLLFDGLVLELPGALLTAIGILVGETDKL